MTAHAHALLITGDSVSRDRFARLTRSAGLHLRTVDSCEAASIELMNSNGEFMVVILDGKLPDADALEFLAECKRAHPRWICTVFISTDDGEQDRALAAGTEIYCTEHCTDEELASRLETARHIAALTY